MTTVLDELKEKLAAIQSGVVPNTYATKTIVDDILLETSSLSLEEQLTLLNLPEYKEADTAYIGAFNSYLMNRFRSEFVATDTGKQVAENLLRVIRTCKSTMLQQHKDEMDEFRKWKAAQESSKQSIVSTSTIDADNGSKPIATNRTDTDTAIIVKPNNKE